MPRKRHTRQGASDGCADGDETGRIRPRHQNHPRPLPSHQPTAANPTTTTPPLLTLEVPSKSRNQPIHNRQTDGSSTNPPRLYRSTVLLAPGTLQIKIITQTPDSHTRTQAMKRPLKCVLQTIQHPFLEHNPHKKEVLHTNRTPAVSIAKTEPPLAH